MLDESEIIELYKSVGVANEKGEFPIRQMNEMSENMSIYKSDNLQEGIDGQLRILKKFCPDFNSCIYESMTILRHNLFNQERLKAKKISVTKVHDVGDTGDTPLICVYAIGDDGKECFFVSDNESKGFQYYDRENFVEQFDRFKPDKDKNGR